MIARLMLVMHCAALVLGLCLPSAAAGQKPSKRPNPKKLVDTWASPTVSTSLSLRGDGTFVTTRRDGTVSGMGLWKLANASMGELLADGAKAASKLLVINEDVIVIQQYLADGGSDGDGYILYRTGYDWAGKQVNKLAADRKALGLIVGRWTHPNIGSIFEAEKQGGWVTNRKAGGEPVTGSWSACDDGSFWIEYETGPKWRAWVTDEGWMALQSFSEETGEMKEDGIVVIRSK